MEWAGTALASIMEKAAVVASLGPEALLLPTRITQALRANDRLKLGLTLLQAAGSHASQPQAALADYTREIAAAGITEPEAAGWLRDLPAQASLHGNELDLPGWARLAGMLGADLQTMAAPLLRSGQDDPLAHRVSDWTRRLASPAGTRVGLDLLAALTHGDRTAGDSLHLLVMELHREINALTSTLALQDVDGAQTWGLDARQEPLVRAFMRGLRRTRELKLDHPGLGTVATADGDALLIQNDIGTNDVHVLVLKVQGLRLTLTYSDLHPQRLEFFRSLLAPAAVQWSVNRQTAPGLNLGRSYTVGVGVVEAADEAALCAALELLSSRIVFLIDWNRARKRLLGFVDKRQAIAVLEEAARRDIGHVPWLRAGGEALVWEAMAAQGAAVFRLGDRLDGVLGARPAADFLLAVMELATQAARAQRPASFVQDEARLLLARVLHSHSAEFDLLGDHAGYCQALAELVDDALARGLESNAPAAQNMASRAKLLERRADELVITARERARRQPHWKTFVWLLEQADEVADAVEEAAFSLSLVADGHAGQWNAQVRGALCPLAQLVAAATQDQVRLLVILRGIGSSSEAADHEEFLTTSWRIVQAEARADELLRAARRILARELDRAAALALANDVAAALEYATDALLGLAYRLRELAFERSGLDA